MQYLSKSKKGKLKIAPQNEGWSVFHVEQNLSKFNFLNRVINYSMIICILSFNIWFIYLYGQDYFYDLNYIVGLLGKPLTIVAFVLAIVVFTFVHEGIHLLFFPKDANSDDVYFGFMGPMVYVYYNGSVSRKGRMKCLLAPFFILLPVFLIPFLVRPGFLSFNLLLAHLGACSGDFMGYREFSKHKNVNYFWATLDQVWYK